MKHALLLLPLFYLITATSCVKSSVGFLAPDTPNNIITISDNTHAKETKVVRIHEDMGKYVHFLENAEATIGISSSRFGPNQKENICAYYIPAASEGVKKPLSSISKNSISINGDNIFQHFIQPSDKDAGKYFGKPLSIAIGDAFPKTKGENCISVDLYSPELVRIESPYVVNDGLFPLCYYQDFMVRWNIDANNINGVVIAVTWDGSMAFGDAYTSSLVYHITRVSDSGLAELDESMFEGIPDAAVCRLYVIRGDVENVEIDEASYMVMVNTRDSFKFVLLRQVEEADV